MEIARQRLVRNGTTTVTSFVGLQVGRASSLEEALRPTYVRPSKVSTVIATALRLTEIAGLAARLA